MAQEAGLNVPVVTGAPSHHTMRGEEKLSPKDIAIRGQEARWVLNALYELNFWKVCSLNCVCTSNHEAVIFIVYIIFICAYKTQV